MKSLVDVCIEVHLLIADLVERVMRLHDDANLLPSTVLLRVLPDTFASRTNLPFFRLSRRMSSGAFSASRSW